jgi:hypothetical protein
MNMKDRVLLIGLAAAFIASVAYTYYHTVVEENFDVVNISSETVPPAIDSLP